MVHDSFYLVRTIPSDLELSTNERNVLAKGLKFIPAPKNNDRNVINDSVARFFRKIRLHAYFNDPNKGFMEIPDDVDDPFAKYKKRSSKWTPTDSPLVIDNFISRCREEIDLVNDIPSQPNISNDEQRALNDLRKRNDIIIKRADKGGAVVVWRRDLYIEEAERQLGNGEFYMKEERDRTEDISSHVKDILSDEIDGKRLPKSALNLVEGNPRCGRFYLLPKIHKPEIPGRPVVSACSCPTSIISAFIDDNLQPLVKALPSYVKDTSHLLNLIGDFSLPPDDVLLFTMDVKSLYTMIPHEEGLQALKYYLDKRTELNPPTSSLIRLAELVLKNNHFEFNGDFYTQTRGVAMGTRMGPSYACLYMGLLEERFHAFYNGPKPLLYKRYIDDVFGVTCMKEMDLMAYINAFNDFNDAIKFTHTISGQSINFLDCTFMVDLQSRLISSTLYSKPTDSHSYLRFDSHHPKKCRESIPFSQFLRLRRLCSNHDDFLKQLEDMKDNFLARGYTSDVLYAAENRVLSITRSESLLPRDCDSENSIPLVIPFNPMSQKVSHIIHKNAKILARDPELGSLFDHNIITAYCNPPNLSNFLVRSKIQEHEIGGTFSCGHNRCVTCNHILNTDNISGPTGSFRINKTFTCTSEGVVYAITCLKCGELYIGETGRMLKTRFREHLSYIRTKKADNELSLHFNGPGHSIDDVAVSGLFFESETNRRRLMESKIITRLGTLAPQGLNRIDDYNFRHWWIYYVFVYVICEESSLLVRFIIIYFTGNWSFVVTLEPEAFISGAWMGIYFLQGFIIPVVCSYLSVPLFCASGSRVSIYGLLLHIYIYISIFLILPPQIFSLYMFL